MGSRNIALASLLAIAPKARFWRRRGALARGRGRAGGRPAPRRGRRHTDDRSPIRLALRGRRRPTAGPRGTGARARLKRRLPSPELGPHFGSRIGRSPILPEQRESGRQKRAARWPLKFRQRRRSLHSAGARALLRGAGAGGSGGGAARGRAGTAAAASAFCARIKVSRIAAIERSFATAAPVPAGMSRPTITFSLRPSSVSTLPLTAASVRTRVGLLAEQEVGFARIDDVNLLQHLAHDHLNVLVVD